MKKDLKNFQKEIKTFSTDRNWTGLQSNIYNMLLNISEETGEVWSVLKWIGNDADMKEVISKNQKELSDGIGDLLWCVLRLANDFGVDAGKALQETYEEYLERFPIDKVKNKKSNPTLGGFDGKYDR